MQNFYSCAFRKNFFCCFFLSFICDVIVIYLFVICRDKLVMCNQKLFLYIFIQFVIKIGKSCQSLFKAEILVVNGYSKPFGWQDLRLVFLVPLSNWKGTSRRGHGFCNVSKFYFTFHPFLFTIELVIPVKKNNIRYKYFNTFFYTVRHEFVKFSEYISIHRSKDKALQYISEAVNLNIFDDISEYLSSKILRFTASKMNYNVLSFNL